MCSVWDLWWTKRHLVIFSLNISVVSWQSPFHKRWHWFIYHAGDGQWLRYRGAVPQRNCSTRPRENERNTLEWTDSLRNEHRRHENLLDQYVTRSVGLKSFRCYTLFKKLASRVWPVVLAVLPCHKFAYSFCCFAVFTQLHFRKHISITSSL